jgi:GxxExxY protein
VEINELTGIIIEEAIKIHKELGPGLLESVYEEVLAYCLNRRGLEIKRQTPISVYFEEVKMDIGFRADIIVENKVVVEIKSVEELAPVHSKIVFTYLRFTNITVALMINFNVPYLKNGIKRIVRNYHSAPSASQRDTKF